MEKLQITTTEGLTFVLQTNGKYQLTLSVGSTGSLTVASDLEKAELAPLMGNEKYALHLGGSGTLVAVYLANHEAKKVADYLGINIDL